MSCVTTRLALPQRWLSMLQRARSWKGNAGRCFFNNHVSVCWVSRLTLHQSLLVTKRHVLDKCSNNLRFDLLRFAIFLHSQNLRNFEGSELAWLHCLRIFVEVSIGANNGVEEEFIGVFIELIKAVLQLCLCLLAHYGFLKLILFKSFELLQLSLVLLDLLRVLLFVVLVDYLFVVPAKSVRQ